MLWWLCILYNLRPPGKVHRFPSKESILKEVKAITEMPDFKGYLSDLGGPSANMYRMKGKDQVFAPNVKTVLHLSCHL